MCPEKADSISLSFFKFDSIMLLLGKPIGGINGISGPMNHFSFLPFTLDDNLV